jgi:S-adenosylmethionine hydrolase
MKSRFQVVSSSKEQTFLGTTVKPGSGTGRKTVARERQRFTIGPDHVLAIVDGRHLQVVRKDKL